VYIDTEYADDSPTSRMFGTDETKWITRRRKSDIGTEAECQETKIMPVTKKQAPHPQVQINSKPSGSCADVCVYLDSKTDANGTCDGDEMKNGTCRLSNE